jgi:hypothetical protein
LVCSNSTPAEIKGGGVCDDEEQCRVFAHLLPHHAAGQPHAAAAAAAGLDGSTTTMLVLHTHQLILVGGDSILQGLGQWQDYSSRQQEISGVEIGYAMAQSTVVVAIAQCLMTVRGRYAKTFAVVYHRWQQESCKAAGSDLC